MKNRIFELIDSLNLTSAEFADKIEVSRSTISSLKTGRTLPTLLLVDKIVDNLPNVNIEWLVRGVGNMFNGNVNTAITVDNDNNGIIEKKSQQQQFDFDDNSNDNTIYNPMPRSYQNNQPQQRKTLGQILNRLPATPTNIEDDEISLDHPNREEIAHNRSSNKQKFIYNGKMQTVEDNNVATEANNAAITSENVMQHVSIKKEERKIIRIITLYSDGTYQQFSPE